MPRSEFHPFLQCHKLRNIFLSFAFRLNYIRETNASFIMQSLFFEIVNIINEISLVTAILFTVLFWRHEESCILHREVESTWAQLIVSQSVAQSPENTRLRCEWWIHREHYVGHESIRVNFFLNHHACCLSCNPPPPPKSVWYNLVIVFLCEACWRKILCEFPQKNPNNQNFSEELIIQRSWQ